MSIWSVIANNSTAIYSVCIPGFAISAGYAAWKLAFAGTPATTSGGRAATPLPTSTPRRPLVPVPGAKPKSLEQGKAEHQARGEAKTVKVPSGPARDERAVDTARMPVADGDDAAKDELFAGLGQAPKKEDTTTLRKAERMEELGFHAQTRPTPAPVAAAEPPASTTSELLTAATAAPPARSVAIVPKEPDAKHAETSTGEELAPKPRTQTQELDDILSRIDKVLADNPVMATTTLGSASHESATFQKPVPPAMREAAARKAAEQPPADGNASGEGEGQQKLF